MIDASRVTKAVSRLLGCTEEELFSYAPVIKAVCKEVFSKLAKPEYGSDSRVQNACTGLSVYRIVLARLLSGEENESFKVGDISVTQSPSLALERASVMRDELMLGAAELLKDDNFLFMKV